GFNDAGGGTATLTGSAGDNSALLYSNGSGQLNNSAYAGGYTVAVRGMTSINAHGHSGDTASFYDALGGASYYAVPDFGNEPFSLMFGSAYSNSALGFGTNAAYATSTAGATDSAAFFDSPGTQTFSVYTDYKNSGQQFASMVGGFGAFGDYTNTAKGFATNVGYSFDSGTDTAKFFDAAGNTTFYAYADYEDGDEPLAGMLPSAGSSYSDSAKGYITNLAFSTAGSSDTAAFFDSPGNDSYSAYANYQGSNQTYAAMTGSYTVGTGTTATTHTYTNSASGFGTNVGNSSNGGTDLAQFYGTSGNNTFYAYADYNNTNTQLAGMYGAGYSNSGNGFST